MPDNLEGKLAGDLPKVPTVAYLVATAMDAGLTMYHQAQLGYIAEGNRFAEVAMDNMGNVPGTLVTIGTEALILYGIIKSIPQRARKFVASGLAVTYAYLHANGSLTRLDLLLNDAIPNNWYWFPSTMMSEKLFDFGNQIYNIIEKIL